MLVGIHSRSRLSFKSKLWASLNPSASKLQVLKDSKLVPPEAVEGSLAARQSNFAKRRKCKPVMARPQAALLIAPRAKRAVLNSTGGRPGSPYPQRFRREPLRALQPLSASRPGPCAPR